MSQVILTVSYSVRHAVVDSVRPRGVRKATVVDSVTVAVVIVTKCRIIHKGFSFKAII